MRQGNANRVRAVVRKELITLTSYRVDLVMRLVHVGYFAVSFYFIGEFVGDPDAIADLSGGYFEFVLVGAIVTNFAIVGLASFAGQISEEQNEGTLEAILTTPTPTWTLVAASHVVPLGFVIVETVILVAVGLGFFGSGIAVSGLLAATPVLLLTTASFMPFGILSAAFIVLVKRGDPFSGPAEKITLLLSGALYPLSVLPGWMEGVAQFLPATHGVRAVRSLAQADAGLGDALDEIALLLVFVVVALPASASLFRRAVTVARRAGTLGTY